MWVFACVAALAVRTCSGLAARPGVAAGRMVSVIGVEGVAPPQPADEPAGGRPGPGHWWQTQVMYQVYPRSFQDSDGDGVGDLKGVEMRLPYLKELGVGFIWLSPIMRSPMRDFGYDISDFTAVDPLFGTLSDFRDLIASAQALGIRILMDFVPNHSSNESAWFAASRSSRTDPKRDWYVWHPGRLLADGSRAPPNNWASNFGGGLGSAWTWDETSKEYYYHAFGDFQPDLNYRNPEVVAAMQDVLRFWLRLGVAGFRTDAVPFLLEDTELRDEPLDNSCALTSPMWSCMLHAYTQNDLMAHEVVHGWRRAVDEFDDRVLFGEIYAPVRELMAYYGTPGRPEFHVPFNFQVLGQDYGRPRELSDAAVVRRTIADYAAAKPGWGHGNWVLGNHDVHRLADRVQNNTALVTTLYALFCLLPGTPTIYYGDELAMQDLWVPYEQCQDPMCINNPRAFASLGRDPERTPMQWSAMPQAGFSSNPRTWNAVHPDYVTVNVEAHRMNASSPLSVLTRTLAFRNNNPEIPLGSIQHVPDGLPEGVRERLVAVQYSTGTSFAITLANLDTSGPIHVDVRSLLPADFGRQPPQAWKVEFSSLPAGIRMDAADGCKVEMAAGAVAVLAPAR